MLNIIERHEIKVDYSEKIRSFDYQEPEDTAREVIDNYKTPNKGYISASARGLDYKDVSYETLEYIIYKCFQCNDNERYQAMLISLYKFYEEHHNKGDAEEMKEGFISLYTEPDKLTTQDFKYLDTLSDNTQHLFYVIQVTIGINTILKFGISNDLLRKRFALLKSNILEKYNKQHVSIEPVMIVECSDNKKFEEEIKILVNELGFEQTGYGFKGYTETLKMKYKDDFINVVVSPLVLELKAKVVFPIVA